MTRDIERLAARAAAPADQAPRRNIELKARLRDMNAARQTARRLSGGGPEVQRQIDTYFHCPRGRLKLREIDGREAQLVAYSRPDEPTPKESQYYLIPVSDPAGLKAALASVLGTSVVVDKRREIYLVDNVRIHLDEVERLGEFLEFEAVLGPTDDEASGRRRLSELSRAFGIQASDLLNGSYADMMDA